MRSGVLSLSILTSLALTVACRSTPPAARAPESDLDRFLSTIPDPEMRALWKRAHAAGELPPLDRIPTPRRGEAVLDLSALRRAEPAAPRPADRPELGGERAPTVEPWCPVPLPRYVGALVVQDVDARRLVGRLEDPDVELELHWRLPDPPDVLGIEKGERLELELVDTSVDAALQRRVVLRDEGGVRLAFVSEGSEGPYRARFPDLGLELEQRTELGAPAVRVTYGGRTVDLRRGEVQVFDGPGEQLVVQVLRTSARDPVETRLTEGRPRHVRAIAYRRIP